MFACADKESLLVIIGTCIGKWNSECGSLWTSNNHNNINSININSGEESQTFYKWLFHSADVAENFDKGILLFVTKTSTSMQIDDITPNDIPMITLPKITLPLTTLSYNPEL